MQEFTVSYAIYGAIGQEPGYGYQPEAIPVDGSLSDLLNAPGATGIVRCASDVLRFNPSAEKKHFGALVNGRFFACEEGQTIDFNHGGGLPAGTCAPSPSSAVVKFAVYGALASGVATATQAIDVTARVQAIVNAYGGRVLCANNNFGDPSPNNKKHFAAWAVRGQAIFCVACEEGQTVYL